MRVASLLPSATEMVHFAGAGGTLVGVTHECDYPPGVERLPKLTSSEIEGRGMTSGEIDAAVESLMTDKGSLYALDAGLLEELAPDLILTQGLCDVCAVSTDLVERAAAGLKNDPEILTLNPTSLRDVLDDTTRVGEALSCGDETREKISTLEGRLAGVRARVAGLPHPRVGCIEWLDPPFSAPCQGSPPCASRGRRSSRPPPRRSSSCPAASARTAPPRRPAACFPGSLAGIICRPSRQGKFGRWTRTPTSAARRRGSSRGSRR